MSEATPREVLDGRGLPCSLVKVRTRRALEKMQPGQVLEVVATDREAVPGLQDYARQSGHTLLRHEQDEAGELHFFFRRKAD